MARGERQPAVGCRLQTVDAKAEDGAEERIPSATILLQQRVQSCPIGSKCPNTPARHMPTLCRERAAYPSGVWQFLTHACSTETVPHPLSRLTEDGNRKGQKPRCKTQRTSQGQINKGQLQRGRRSKGNKRLHGKAWQKSKMHRRYEQCTGLCFQAACRAWACWRIVRHGYRKARGAGAATRERKPEGRKQKAKRGTRSGNEGRRNEGIKGQGGQGTQGTRVSDFPVCPCSVLRAASFSQLFRL